jgi:hypothetical protein
VRGDVQAAPGASPVTRPAPQVCHSTASEAAPSLFRLAVACRIFDHVCAVPVPLPPPPPLPMPLHCALRSLPGRGGGARPANRRGAARAGGGALLGPAALAAPRALRVPLRRLRRRRPARGAAGAPRALCAPSAPPPRGGAGEGLGRAACLRACSCGGRARGHPAPCPAHVPEAGPWSPQDYARLLPFFLATRRLEAERAAHAATIAKAPARPPAGALTLRPKPGTQSAARPPPRPGADCRTAPRATPGRSRAARAERPRPSQAKELAALNAARERELAREREDDW